MPHWTRVVSTGVSLSLAICLAAGCASSAADDDPSQVFQTLQTLENQVAEVPDTEQRDEMMDTVKLLQVQLQHGDVDMPPAAAMMLVHDIQILPVTQAGDWNEDGTLDGFEVFVEAQDGYGDSTKAVGTFYFELFPYRPAHADPKGIQRVAFWQVDVKTPEEAVRYWDRFSRNYHFNLVWKSMPDVGQQYVFQATYVTPWGKKITTQRTLKRVK